MVLTEVMVPIGILLGISVGVLGEAWRRMHSVIIGGGNLTTPSDVNGTLWFYWWTAKAQERGADLINPDVICAPTGQALGSNFPQHIDALLAAPLMAHLPTPQGFNLFVAFIPVLGGWCAYLAARWLGLGRVTGMMVAILFGFNSLSMHEISNGKPPSALVFTIPIFVAAWIRSLTTRGKASIEWIVIAGVTAGLAIQHYVLYALISAIFAAGALAKFTVYPAPGVSRRRAPIAGLVVVILGVLIASPYLTQLLSERRPMPAASSLRITDPSVLREQAESIDVGYLLGVDDKEDLPRRAAFPVILTIAAIVLLPFGGRRHRHWLAGALGFYLLSLGPMAAISVRPEVEWMTIAGRGVPLPTWWLNQIFPFSIQFFHPCRVFPMVVLCMALSVGMGLEHAFKTSRSAWVHPILALVVAGLGFFHVKAQGGMTILSAEWEPHSFFQKIAKDPNPGALIEFPVGLGHATAPHQLIHEWKRSESHHDMIAALKANQRPEDCLTSSIFDSLWAISRGEASEGPTASEITEARRDGFRYLVVHKAGFDVLRQAGLSVDRERSIQILRSQLGDPLVHDDSLVVFSLEARP